MSAAQLGNDARQRFSVRGRGGRIRFDSNRRSRSRQAVRRENGGRRRRVVLVDRTIGGLRNGVYCHDVLLIR